MKGRCLSFIGLWTGFLIWVTSWYRVALCNLVTLKLRLFLDALERVVATDIASKNTGRHMILQRPNGS
jgi:hypothetical protein